MEKGKKHCAAPRGARECRTLGRINLKRARTAGGPGSVGRAVRPTRRRVARCAAEEPRVAGAGEVNGFDLEAQRAKLEQVLARPSEAAAPRASSYKGDEYDELRGEFSRPKMLAFFQKGTRPALVAARLAVIMAKLTAVGRLWVSEDGVPAEERTREVALREALSELGPVFTKIGQTLSQRADLIGDDAANALKKLQEQNKPFEDELAWRTIAEDLSWDGPLAPGHPYMAAEAEVALDWTCWAAGLDVLRRVWNSEADLSVIADEVAVGVWQELDYHIEAANADEFRERHEFLGFVTAPHWFEEYSGPRGRARVLTMEWMDGQMLGEIVEPERKLQLAQMAVEACVAQLVYTGFVHADPHEGNLMLLRDGRLAFLDFGLMSRVEPAIMEGFAKGIQHVLASDWVGLTYVFRDVGFAPPDKFYRYENNEPIECSAEEVAAAIGARLESVEGGTSRFGALATVLGGLSGSYKFFTPPYIVLLCRTFLTLEVSARASPGCARMPLTTCPPARARPATASFTPASQGIAGKADPDFNIYEASLPFAVKRAFAPSTPAGEEALRNAFLEARASDVEGEFKYRLRTERILEALGAESEDAAGEAAEGAEGGGEAAAAAGGASGGDAVAQQRGIDTMKGLVGERRGAALRKVAYDACPVEFSEWISGKEASVARRKAVHMLAEVMAEQFPKRVSAAKAAAGAGDGAAEAATEEAADKAVKRGRESWPVSPAAARMKQRSEANSRRVMRTILGDKLRRMVRGGPAGLLALVRLSWVGLTVMLRAAFLVATRGISDTVKAAASPKVRAAGGGQRPPSAAPAAA
eukprot:PRCOL_00004998-RA